MKKKSIVITLALVGACLVQYASAETKPLKALLLTGGCCHDYAAQKDLLKKGIEARGNIIVDQIHTDDTSSKPNLPIYGLPEYSKGYDVVIHNECAADISDDKIVKGVISPHQAGTPAVNLHCAMHSYRAEKFKKPVKETGTPSSQWFEFVGIQSTSHGPKKPVSIVFVDKKHPITKPLGDWVTSDEELYNNVTVFPTAHPLATGEQLGKTAVVTWTNDYKGTRVFNTSIGHFNETISDPRYLDLVTRGLLWVCGKLDDEGNIVEGYEASITKK
ncbi:MAG: ThuA domain-containing protein [Verrucomicrobiota bacterium]